MSSKETRLKEQERVAILFGVLFTIWFLFSLGPMVVIMAALTGLVLAVWRPPLPVIGIIIVVAAVIGVLSTWDLTIWLTGPIYSMWDLYSHYCHRGLLFLLFHPDALNNLLDILSIKLGEWMSRPGQWAIWWPAGTFWGAIAYGLLQIWQGHPLGNLKRQKIMEKPHGSVSQLAANINDKREAHTVGGSIIGADKYARMVELTDRAANQHTLVLGTTGSGKTVTVGVMPTSA